MIKALFLIPLLSILLYADSLTLKECVEKALSTHPDIKTFILKIEQSKETVKIERSEWRPQISAFGEYDPQKTYLTSRNGRSQTVQDNGWIVGMSLTQKLYDFSKTSSRIDAAKIEEKIASLSLEDMKNLMRYRVSAAYALLLVQKAAIGVRKEDLKTKKAFLDEARELVSQGLKTRADESRFQSAVEKAKDALARSVAAYEKAKIELENYIGEAVPETADLQKGLLSSDAWRHIADENEMLKKNPQLRIAMNECQASDANYRSIKAEQYGALDAVADYSRIGALSNYNSTLLGVRYKVPLYTGNRLTSQMQKAKISKMIANEKVESRRRALLQSYRSIKEDLKRIKETIKAKSAQIESASETKKVVEGRYTSGLATYLEVLDASLLWLDAKLGLLQAHYETLQAAFRIRYLTGENYEF